MPLDLLVPELLCAAPVGGSPSIERWLSRADTVRNPARSATAWLGKAFGLDPVPVAALEQAAAGLTGGSWMRVDPIHLRVEGDALRLHEPALLSITKEEADALVSMLQSHFAADGIDFEARTPERWYVRLPKGEAPVTTPLYEAAGRNVFGLIPAEAKWRNALTEAQMLLSSHEVNARREAEGKPAINSIWFWGAGPLPAAPSRTYAAIYADDPLARGLGVWSGARVHSLPAGIAEVDLERESESILAVVSHATAEFDERWFGPLAKAIDRFDRVRLILPSREDTVVATLTASARWRIFRRAKPLSAYA